VSSPRPASVANRSALVCWALFAACGTVERDDGGSDADTDADTDADGPCGEYCAHAAECAWPGFDDCEADCGCLSAHLLGDDAVDPYFACVEDLACDFAGPSPMHDCGDAAATVIGPSADEKYLDECESWGCAELPCGFYALFTNTSVDSFIDCLRDEPGCAAVAACTDAVLSASCSAY